MITPEAASELAGWSIIAAGVVLVIFIASLPAARKKSPPRPPTRRREAETKPRAAARQEAEEQKARTETITIRPLEITGLPTPAPPAPREPQPGDPEFYRQQAELIRSMGFYKAKRLLNSGEEKVFWKLVGWCRDNSCRVFPQVSLGEVFSSSSDEHYRAINSKRADFVITDSRFQPIALIEYHGSGHWLSDNTIARDAVKRAAAESAGLAYVAIHRGQEQRAARLVEEGLESMRQAAAERAAALQQQLDQLSRIARTGSPSR